MASGRTSATFFKRSGTGAEIDAGALPLSPAYRAAVGEDPALALGGGEDYELLFCLRHAVAASALTRRLGVRVSRIGRITSSGKAMLAERARSRPRRRAAAQGMGPVAFAAKPDRRSINPRCCYWWLSAARSERPARRLGNRAVRAGADAAHAGEPGRGRRESRRIVAAPSARIADGDHRVQRGDQCLRRMPRDHFSPDLAGTAGRMDLGAGDVRAGAAGQRHHAQDLRARVSGRGGAASPRVRWPRSRWFSIRWRGSSYPRGRAPAAPLSESEFKALLVASERLGQVAPAERELIDKVFAFGSRRVSEIMTPRERIFALDLDTAVDHIIAEVAHGHYSRVPVYRGNPNNIVGVLRAKDLVARRLESVAAAPGAPGPRTLLRAARQDARRVVRRDAPAPLPTCIRGRRIRPSARPGHARRSARGAVRRDCATNSSSKAPTLPKSARANGSSPAPSASPV